MPPIQQGGQPFSHEAATQQICNYHASAFDAGTAVELMQVVDTWTGELAEFLRQAFRMTIEDFATKQLGVAPRTVAYWRQRPSMIPKAGQQAILDTTLERAPDTVKTRFARLVERGIRHGSTFEPSVLGLGSAESNCLPKSSGTDARSVVSWIESSNTSQDVIEYLRSETVRAAEQHASQSPKLLLPKVQQLHGMIQALLRGGKQRYQQTAELIQLDSEVLAHLSQLLGDVHRDSAAFEYARASIALADEVGASAAAAFSAQAQIARWRGRYTEAADLAAEGLKRSLPGPLRTLLAHQEANAAAIGGDRRRARLALDRSDATAAAGGRVYSAWSCPPARLALYRIGVALNMGEPQEAVRQAADAESMWQRERTKAFATWAHFQISAARAHVLTGSLEGAVEYVTPVLSMPQELRVSTVADNMATLDVLLMSSRFAGSSNVSSLREQMRVFTTSSSAATRESETQAE